MKPVRLAALAALIFVFSCMDTDTASVAEQAVLADTATYTQIQWLDSIVSFGSINKGEKIQMAFRFRNTGRQPLFLANVRAGCGCTVPDYTRGAIAPGVEGVVNAVFDSNKSAAGDVRKSIFVTTNTHDKTSHTLIFTGLIKEMAK